MSDKGYAPSLILFITMKKLNLIVALFGTAAMLASCGSSKVYMEAFSPEESSLNLVKITDESMNPVLAGTVSSFQAVKSAYGGLGGMLRSAYASAQQSSSANEYGRTTMGVFAKERFSWNTNRLLAVSPDGKKLAYATRMNKQDNIMVRNTTTQSVATQRTFRNVNSFCWGNDNRLYFADYVYPNMFISSVNADAGSMMDQITNGSVLDKDPAYNAETKQLFFVRIANDGPSIWCVNRNDGTLTSCARGFSPCVIPSNPNAFYCVRNSDIGRSEIWYVDFFKGQEVLVLSDENHSFTNPTLSPDGKWIAVMGNSESSISRKTNLDVFVVRTDGTRLTQLTYHPANDTNPVWAKDGRSIYFISSRANKDEKYNVWRMNFNVE